MTATVIPLTQKNCIRCGKDFSVFGRELVCIKCRKPQSGGRARVDTPITLRQWQIAALAAQGLMDKEIAFELHMRTESVKTIMGTVLKKFHASSRTELSVLVLTPFLLEMGVRATMQTGSAL